MTLKLTNKQKEAKERIRTPAMTSEMFNRREACVPLEVEVNTEGNKIELGLFNEGEKVPILFLSHTQTLTELKHTEKRVKGQLKVDQINLPS